MYHHYEVKRHESLQVTHLVKYYVSNKLDSHVYSWKEELLLWEGKKTNSPFTSDPSKFYHKTLFWNCKLTRVLNNI